MNYLRSFLVLQALTSITTSYLYGMEGPGSFRSLKQIAAERVIKNATQADDVGVTYQEVIQLPEEIYAYVGECVVAKPLGRSLLHNATSSTEVMQLVAGLGINPTIRTVTGETPLMTLIRDGKREEAKTLLEFMKENIIPYDQVDIQGQSALDIAKRFEDAEMVEMLDGDTPQLSDYATGDSIFAAIKKNLFFNAKSKKESNTEIKQIFEEMLVMPSCYEAAKFLQTLPKQITLGDLAKEAHKANIYTGLTPLHMLVNPEQVDMMLSIGANFNISSKEGQRPLHYYIKTGKFDVALRLLEAANSELIGLDVRDHLGMTPFGYAIFAGHKALIEVLIEKGTNVFNIVKLNNRSFNPLSLFLRPSFYRPELVPSIFCPEVLQKISDSSKMSLLKDAVRNNFDEVIKVLLGENTFETFVDSKNGMNFVMYLAKNKHNKTLKSVLSQVKNLENVDHQGNTAMFYALLNKKNIKVLSILLRCGVNLNHQNNQGRTPLHYAQKNDHYLKELLKYKPNPNISSMNGNTPLHEALEAKNLEGAKLLLDYGADVNIQNNKGETPLHIAVFESPDFVDTLLGYHPMVDIATPSGKTALMFALVNNNPTIAKQLLAVGANTCATDANGRTVLHYVVNCCPEVIGNLRHKTAIINARDHIQCTALHYAIMKKDFSTVQMLTHLGADLDCQDEQGRTPLMLALKNSCRDIVIWLLMHDANRFVTDNNDNDCVYYIPEAEVVEYFNILRKYKKD